MGRVRREEKAAKLRTGGFAREHGTRGDKDTEDGQVNGRAFRQAREMVEKGDREMQGSNELEICHERRATEDLGGMQKTNSLAIGYRQWREIGWREIGWEVQGGGRTGGEEQIKK